MTHTTDSPAVSVIVPVYNEEENVPILQAELRAALKAIDHEFIFVDDGSPITPWSELRPRRTCE
jgi:Glycosyltransferases involved in cell wall biogenesis